MLSDYSKTSPAHKDRFYNPFFTVFLTLSIYMAGKFWSLMLFLIYPTIFNQPWNQFIDTFERSILIQFLHVFLIECFLLILITIVIKARKITIESIGLIRPRLKDLGYMLVGFGYYYPIVLLLGYILNFIVPGFDKNQIQDVGFSGASGGSLILVFVALAVLPPLVEEILFRGFLYSGLRSRIGVIAASSIVSIIFAAAHLSGGVSDNLLWVAAIDTFILSQILIYLRERTGSLWASIGLHAIKNTVAFLGLFIFVR